MLEYLRLEKVGPALEMEMDLGSRLNVITGDNGLGKTMLLDSMWWTLTRTWPLTWGGKGLVPETEGAEIAWVERRDSAAVRTKARYDFDGAVWKTTEQVEEPRPPRQEGALVVYLRVDGGISVHDPLRVGEDFRLPARQRAMGQSHAFQFREPEIWDGLELQDSDIRVCEGLVRDVVRWAVEPGSAEFEHLAELVEHLAGEEPFRLTHKVGRVYVDDSRDFPFLAGPAGPLPAAYAPAGLRRILSLAYLVVWAWREHRVAAGLKKRAPSTSLVLLIDEVESHLHPKWQRTILPSLLLALGKGVHLQVVATTHSPLVLASLEPVFDSTKDAWFDMDLVGEGKAARVVLEKRPFARMGTAGRWLTSAAFDLSSEGRAPRAVEVLDAAAIALSDPSFDKQKATQLDRELRSVLGDTDPFWTRWRFVGESRGWLPSATKVIEPPKAKQAKPRAKKPRGKT